MSWHIHIIHLYIYYINYVNICLVHTHSICVNARFNVTATWHMGNKDKAIHITPDLITLGQPSVSIPYSHHINTSQLQEGVFTHQPALCKNCLPSHPGAGGPRHHRHQSCNYCIVLNTIKDIYLLCEALFFLGNCDQGDLLMATTENGFLKSR